MALANGVRFIWLDAHIGQEGQYDGFKRQFRTALEPTTPMPPDAIDSLIYALNENAAPFLFADTPDEAIRLIQENHDKKISFISSGSLGVQIIPRIVGTYPQVHSFYFFCALIRDYRDFALDYMSCLQMFTHEMDLLVRLVRDISADIIRQGRVYLELTDPKNALKCFTSARTLNTTANTLDTFNSSYLEDLRLLNGHNGRIGLITQAEDMLCQQENPATQEEENEVAQNEDDEHDGDEQISQQESQSP